MSSFTPKYSNSSFPNTSSSPNIHSSLFFPKSTSPLSPSPLYTPTLSHTPKMSNDMYTTSITPRVATVNGMGDVSNGVNTGRNANSINTGSKLTEMSSDLAKLKEQLSKIMGKADRFEKKKVGVDSSFTAGQQMRKGQQQVRKETVSLLAVDKQRQYQPIGRSSSNNYNATNPTDQPPNYPKPITTPTPLNQTTITTPTSTTTTQQTYTPSSFSPSYQRQLTPSTRLMNTSLPDLKHVKYSNLNGRGDDGSEKRVQQGVLGVGRLGEQLEERQEGTSKDFLLRLNGSFGRDGVNVGQQSGISIKGQSVEQYVGQSVAHPVEESIEQATIIPLIHHTPTPQTKPFPPPVSHTPPSYTSSAYAPPSYTPPHPSSPHSLLSSLKTQQLSKRLSESSQLQQLRKKKHQEQFQYQQKIIELENQKRRLKHEFNSVMLEKEHLEGLLTAEKSQRELMARKFREVQEMLRAARSDIEDHRIKYRLLQRKYEQEVALSTSKTVSSSGTRDAATFNQALKQLIHETNGHKQKLQEKDEEIARLKELSTMHRREVDSLHNMLTIEQLKSVSLLNETQSKHSIALQDKENELKTYKNLFTTLQSKLQVAINENRSKDAFMVQHLTGKVKLGEDKQYVVNFFKKYEVEVSVGRMAEKLREEMTEIDRLKRVIVEMMQEKHDGLTR